MDQISRKRLSGLECGQSGHVYAVVSADKRMRRHIVDMGITPGTEIKLVKLAPMGDPLEIELRGYTMSLRKSRCRHDSADERGRPQKVARGC